MSTFSNSPSFSFRKLMIFIDGTNFLAGCINFKKGTNKKWKISYPEIESNLRALAVKDALIRLEHIKTFYYGPQGVPEKVKGLEALAMPFSVLVESFQKELQLNHVRLVLKDKINGKEKNIDAALVTDLLSLAFSGAYDYAVLITGDADFISAIDEVKRLGKMVCVSSFKSDFNEALRQHVDKFIPLDSLAESFLKPID